MSSNRDCPNNQTLQRPVRLNPPAPSRARRVVLFFAVTLAVITYVDRVCISQAAPAMQSELGLTKIQMGYAFTAFGWAYALFVCEPRGQAIVYESYKRMLKIERSALSVSSSEARKVRSADGKYDS